MHAYHELLVRKQAIDLAEIIYLQTAQFPPLEHPGMVARMRHTATLIPAHLAFGIQNHASDFLPGLGQAERALCQLEIEVWLAHRLHYWSAFQFLEITRRMTGLRRLFRALFNCLQPRGSSLLDKAW